MNTYSIFNILWINIKILRIKKNVGLPKIEIHIADEKFAKNPLQIIL